MFLVYLFLLHFIADFLLQPREMGKKKSSNVRYLMAHVGIQVGVFLIGLWVLTGSFLFALSFALLNGAIHGVIDAFIWKGYALLVWLRRKEWMKDNEYYLSSVVSKAGGIGRGPHENEIKNALKKKWKYWEDHWFYVTIGFDQFLHMASLVLVLLLLI